jgi:predicted nucleic acid-binding protein
LHEDYLLDTSVVSALARGRETFAPAALGEWLPAHHEVLFLPFIAIAEMAQGISKLRRAGGGERADRLDRWLDGLLAACGERILPLHAHAGWLASQISEAAMAQGCYPGFADVAIAALARHGDLLLLTCNVKHFQPLGRSTGCLPGLAADVDGPACGREHPDPDARRITWHLLAECWNVLPLFANRSQAGVA